MPLNHKCKSYLCGIFLSLTCIVAYGQQVTNDEDQPTGEAPAKLNQFKFSFFEFITARAAFYYERTLRNGDGLEIGLGYPFLVIYNENYDYLSPVAKVPTGVISSLAYHRYGNKKPQTGIGFKLPYRLVHMNNINRIYEWSLHSDGEGPGPSKWFPYESLICNECSATLNETRHTLNPQVYFIWRNDLEKDVSVEFTSGLGCRFAAYRYSFSEIYDFQTDYTFTFDDYRVWQYHIYPTVNIGLKFGLRY